MNLAHLRYWAHRNRRILLLKAGVAGALLLAHYFPESGASVWVNLLWLAMF